ncbi:hypothetical protein ACKQTC_08140 [Peptococcus simiae]|uniref:Ppx/GppA phosphatase N-terminal domain-containing protein n=1 Tax=Peptococcus simiae TaxID=1643805 RepID=A0ABW9H0F7_9FIRM
MKYAVIDIGSNTMRAVIYEVINDDFEVVINEKNFAELISYIEDNLLTEAGISRLCRILKKMRVLCDETNTQDILCFATASLRYIDNQKEVLERVKEETGISIQLLDGCDESYYDFIGLRAAIGEPEAIGFDLGGGSAQLFYYRDNRLVKSMSEPIGTLAMYNQYVKGLFPNSKERNKIRKRVSKSLENAGDFKAFKQKRLYGMGGTARALAKVHRHLVGNDRAIDYKLTLEDIMEVDRTLSDLGLSGIKILNRILPERLVTFLPGLLIIEELMRHVGANELVIIGYGVREGYLIENAINKGRGINEFRDSDIVICQ